MQKLFVKDLLALCLRKNLIMRYYSKIANQYTRFFMRFDLNIIYLDKKDKVINVIKQVKPFRIILPIKNACSILEIPSNIIENIDPLIGKKLIDF
jgi:uncharacterized membrane protein (UPF0127 family)